MADDHKIYQIATKYTTWPLNRPNGHEIYQHLPLQVHLENPKIRIFGLKKMASDNPGVVSIFQLFFSNC
jgi:hypothetical protein